MSLSGVIVSCSLAEQHVDNLKAIAMAVLIKERFPRNGTIYDYNPHRVAEMFSMNYNTVKSYVNYLLSCGIARMHHGNLTIGRLRHHHSKRNCVRVSGSIKSIVEALRQFIITSNIQHQRSQISHKEGIKSTALCRNLKEVRRFMRARRYGDISDIKIDELVRMTLNKIQDLLHVSRALAVEIRRNLIDIGYGFCYETRILCDARSVSPDDLPGNAYFYKGHVLVRDSWVQF